MMYSFEPLLHQTPSLCWDICHTDFWLQCVTSTPSPAIRWPYPHCGATNRFLTNCLFRLYATPTSSSGQPLFHHFYNPQWAANLPPSRVQLNYRPFTCHTLTVQPAAVKIAHSLIAVYSVVPTSVKHCPSKRQSC